MPLFAQIGAWVELPNAPVVSRFNDIEFLNENNKVVDTGQIIFANLNLQNTDLQLYKYEYRE